MGLAFAGGWTACHQPPTNRINQAPFLVDMPKTEKMTPRRAKVWGGQPQTVQRKSASCSGSSQSSDPRRGKWVWAAKTDLEKAGFFRGQRLTNRGAFSPHAGMLARLLSRRAGRGRLAGQHRERRDSHGRSRPQPSRVVPAGRCPDQDRQAGTARRSDRHPGWRG